MKHRRCGQRMRSAACCGLSKSWSSAIPSSFPLTDFFSRADGLANNRDADDDETAEDIDAKSILEVCQATFNERRRLKWHYRSRCESLIAFSNQAFYDGSLLTFPMPKPGSFSIELVRVDGTYRDRRNPAEAERIAEEAIAFMRHFAESPEETLPTLGIVAINGEQRDLIFEELRQLSSGDELVERYREKAEIEGRAAFRQEPRERAGRRARPYFHLNDIRPKARRARNGAAFRADHSEAGAQTPERAIYPRETTNWTVHLVRLSRCTAARG